MHNKGINPDFIELMHHLLNTFELVVVDDRVERYVHLGTKDMGMFTQALNVG